MAAPSNDAANLVEEFEESFQSCLNVLTKQEAGPCVEKEEVKVEVERFIDLARQMEAFFLQKRFLLSALKPELLVKEDNNDLRVELARKEELLKKHLDKIAMWQNLLNDLQGYSKCSGQAVSAQTASGVPPQQVSALPPSQQPTPSGMMPMSATQTPHNTPMQMQQMSMTPPQQMQHASQLQQMHHHQQQQAIQMGVPGGMFMGQGGPRGTFPPPGSLQGPLAYLEKTTTNIDLVGMGDGRR